MVAAIAAISAQFHSVAAVVYFAHGWELRVTDDFNEQDMADVEFHIGGLWRGHG